MRNQSPTKIEQACRRASEGQLRMKTQFEQEVLSLRVDKDSFLKNDIDSPIPPNERANFKGLNYFPPDPGYRVASKLEDSIRQSPSSWPLARERHKPTL